MMFNSYTYIFFFLPISAVIYFLLHKNKFLIAARGWLIICSLVYYSWIELWFTAVFVSSIIGNYLFGLLILYLSEKKPEYKKPALIAALICNITVLGFYKYTDFFISNINFFIDDKIGLLKMMFPLGISFFTFIQISYIVDTYRGQIKEKNFFNYFRVISFFPQLLSGPIIRYREMIPQFQEPGNQKVNFENIAAGLFLFSLGLFKKVIFADQLAPFADTGFSMSQSLTFLDSWITSLSYTFQLYFDFSGYTDMAIGTALIFNIKLPINFDSPYKALNIQDFWRRWHITLSSFIRDYIYIPLGGNRKGEIRTYINLIATFGIAGIWHGAGWNFVIWGLMHGAALAIHRIWKKTGIKLPDILALFMTFNFVNIAWVFFRARTFGEAMNVLKGMFLFRGIALPLKLQKSFAGLESQILTFSKKWLVRGDGYNLIVLMGFLLFCIFMKNSNDYLDDFRPNKKNLALASFLIIISIVFFKQYSEFIYFNF